jgi:hypothetical protein
MSFDCRWSFPKSRFHLHRPSILMIFGPLPKAFRNVGMLQPAQQAFYGFALLRLQLANRFLHHLRAVGGGERLDLFDYLDCRHELSKSQVVNGVNLAAGTFNCLIHSLEKNPGPFAAHGLTEQSSHFAEKGAAAPTTTQPAFAASLLGQASFNLLRIKTIG